MGVQYHGVTESSSFSMNGGGGQRQADLVLEPTKEGLDFTLRLLAANRMAKVVQIQCDFGGGQWKMNNQDTRNLFQAIGGTMDDNDNNNDDDYDDDYEDVVMEEYQPPKQSFRGMPLLESLSIVCQNATAETPSFLAGVTHLMSASASCPRLTRLSLDGVNLRGGALEVRGLAETLRLHPKHVQMQSCWFTPEQQAHVHVLQSALQEKQSSMMYPTEVVSAGLRQRNKDTQSSNSLLHSQHQDDDDDDHDRSNNSNDTTWWGTRFWKSCFCCW